MPEKPPRDAVHPLTRADWRDWLREHHDRPEGVWLVSWKRSTAKPRVEYDEAVEEALCFGWVDSTAGTVDDERSQLWFAPRRKGSGWSRSNKERVERLVAAGLMEPPGLAKIDAAKADGSWSKLDAVEALEVPNDLASAFAGHPGSAAKFAAFPPGVRRAILAWIVDARRPETRAKRVDETARLARKGERANEPKTKV
jgi:uncharacterized protein YdeI (YjbR/CyaY-like superfamily)